MKREEVMSVIRMLSHSQGFYGRLLRSIEEADEGAKRAFFSQFKDCHSDLDVILKIEC